MQGIKTPAGLNSDSVLSRVNQAASGNVTITKRSTESESKEKKVKYLKKLKTLSKFQTQLMQSVLQKIDRCINPIRKNSELVSKNLEKKNIFLDQENFDILKLLQHRQPLQKCKERRRESVGEVERATQKKTGGLKRQKIEEEQIPKTYEKKSSPKRNKEVSRVSSGKKVEQLKKQSPVVDQTPFVIALTPNNEKQEKEMFDFSG